MPVTTPMEDVLRRLPAPSLEALALSWLTRGVRVHLSALLQVAGDEAAAARLRLFAPAETFVEAIAVRDALLDVLDQAVEDWHRAIDDARSGRTQWDAVLETLGPDQVTPWSVFLHFIEDLTHLLDSDDDAAALAAAIARWARQAARTVATLRAGAAPVANEVIGDAVEAEEEARQRREALARLPV